MEAGATRAEAGAAGETGAAFEGGAVGAVKTCESGLSRAAMSLTVQRRTGSRFKQCRAISRYRAGRVSGTSGSGWRVEGEWDSGKAGKRCVSASTRVMPRDQTSPAGELARWR